MKPHLEIIEKDALGIVEHLKDIEDTYFVVYNHKRGCFEVHNTENKGNTFCMAVKYPRLDYRVVLDTKYSYSPLRAEKVLRELEEDERRRERDNDKKRAEFAKKTAERLLKPIQKMAWEGV